jgi:light-regulated signal transduction histidine kinase (bacteriophytochrome)
MTYGAFVQAIHEEDRQRIDDAVQKALQEKTEYSVEMRVIIPDGQVRWIMSKGFAFNDDQGKTISMHGISLDITSRKRAEDKIEQLNSKLAERAADLESANAELGAFNHTVSHDLRQPLSIINSACQAIELMNHDKLDEDSKGCLKIAINGVTLMSNLIETLLKFSNSAHSVMRQEIVQLDIIANILAANLRMTEPERQVTFRIAEGLTAIGDPELLYIVLDNLIGNAWKYTGRQKQAVIDLGSTEHNGTTTYFVRDNGPGFSMADAEKLFIPFNRLPGTAEFIGHGIGLATVDRIIRRHNGKLWAEAVPGSGATFYFTLHP